MNTHDTIISLFQPFVGLAGGPMVQQFVQFLKGQFRLPIYLAPYVAILVAVVLNVEAAVYFQQNISDGFVIGIFSGFLACGWHEITK